MVLSVISMFVGTMLLLAVFARRVNPRRQPWDATIGAAYATAGIFGVFFAMRAVTNLTVAVGAVTLVMTSAVVRIGEFGERHRLRRVRQALQRERRTAEICLAVLPVTVARILHPRRETGRCSCTAQRVSGWFPRSRPVTLALSTVSLTLWRRTRGRYHLQHELPLGEIYDARLVRTVYRLLSPFRGDATDVDGGRLPAGFTYRLRLTMADRSDVFLTARSRHNTRLFLELFTQVLRDGELRILAVLERDDRTDLADLRQRTGMPAATLTRHLWAMAERELVDLEAPDGRPSHPVSAAITETGLHLLWVKADSMSRIVTPSNDIPI